jgi:hypothetical protein
LVCSFFNSPRAVPIPATPAASIAAVAAFVATRVSFDPALETDSAFDFDDVLDLNDALAFVGFFTFDLTAARFGDDLDLARFVVFFMALSRLCLFRFADCFFTMPFLAA